VLVAWLAALVAVPLAAGLAWSAWTDHVRAASPATEWLTSARLGDWLYGTARQRAVLSNWSTIRVRITDLVVPGLFVFTVPAAAVFAWRRRGATALAVLAALVGAAAPLAIFFNLYVIHDYYLIAVTPPIAVVVGAGVVEIASWQIPGRRLVLAALVLVAAWSALGSEARRFVRLAYADQSGSPIERLARRVQTVTPPDRWVVVEGDDWNPRILYRAHRRGFMIKPKLVDVAPLASRPEWGALVCRTCPPSLLALWPDRIWVGREGGFEIYQLRPAGNATGR
jgi:hypothetical protein